MEEELLAAAAAPVSDRQLLWSRIDAPDVATACRQAVETEDAASGTYNIGASHVFLGTGTRDLMSRYWPTTELRPTLMGSLAALSCQKARAAFDFEPAETVHHRKE
jgi:hypothetical protein